MLDKISDERTSLRSLQGQTIATITVTRDGMVHLLDAEGHIILMGGILQLKDGEGNRFKECWA